MYKRQQQELKKQAELKKQEELKKQQAEEKKQAEAKKEAEKKKAEASKKKADDAARKKEAKQLEDDLFSDLDSDTPGSAGNKTGPGSGNGDDQYSGLVADMVKRNMLIDRTMFGKTAILKVRIAPDGLVISAGPCDGNPTICNAGIAAVNRIGKFPKPPQDYGVLSLTLDPGGQ